jgi:hypothetical protein
VVCCSINFSSVIVFFGEFSGDSVDFWWRKNFVTDSENEKKITIDYSFFFMMVILKYCMM